MQEALLQSFVDAIEAEGLIAEREEDDDAQRISFKSEGDRYFVVAYRNDANFVMIGSGWSLGEHAPLDRALEVANSINARKKFVKVAIWEDERNVMFTVELCLEPDADPASYFCRLLDVLREAAAEFFASLRE